MADESTTGTGGQESRVGRPPRGWSGATPSMSPTPQSAQPGSTMLIMDVCGAFMRPLGGWFSIATIVALMAELGVDERATRSALLRMKRRELLVSETRRTQRGYRLSDQALPLLAESEQRIFGYRTPARLADGWTLVSFSIPEEERPNRHILRSRLSWLGFGMLSNGLWIAPRRMLRELEKNVEELGFQRYVTIFDATFQGFGDVTTLVERAWDIEELADMYREYVDWARPVAERWRSLPDSERRQAFIDYTLALYHWRKFPYLDPGLPPELLPEDWTGAEAGELFRELHERLEGLATAYVRQMMLR